MQKSIRFAKVYGYVFAIGIPLLALIAVYYTSTITDSNFVRSLPNWASLPFLETHYAYLFLHVFTLIPVFALSFDRNVHFYKKWRFLFPSILVWGSAFIFWDAAFSELGVWGFNEQYIVDKHLLTLPIEEVFFFVSVPYACVFVYECLNFYVKSDPLKYIEPYLTPVLGFGFWVLAIFNWELLNTALTGIFAGTFILWHWLWGDSSYRSRFYLSFLVSSIPFLLVDGALTGSFTEEAIIIYNPREFMNVRIGGTIPFEDYVYGFLLVFGVVTTFEYLRKAYIAK